MIKKADASDLPWAAKTLRKIAGGMFRIPETFDVESALAEFKPGQVLIGKKDEDRVGILVMTASPAIFNPLVTVATVVSWWVEPSWRDMGIGAELLAHAHMVAADLGAEYVSIFVAEGPQSGVSIARRFGFRPLERVYTRKVG